MNRKNKILRVVLVVIMLAAIMGSVIHFTGENDPEVKASGTSTVNCTILYDLEVYSGNHESWVDQRADTADDDGTNDSAAAGIRVGTSSINDFKYNMQHMWMGFNCTAVDPSWEITNMYALFYVYGSEVDTFTQISSDLVLLKAGASGTNSWLDELYAQRVTNSYMGSLTAGTWIEMPLVDALGGYSYVQNDADGTVWFDLMMDSQWGWGADPLSGLPPASFPHSVEDSVQIAMSNNGFGAPQIIVEYVTVGDDRTPDVTIINGAVDGSTTGTEVASGNVTWLTPRAVYDDESMWIGVSGDSGANVTLEMRDVNGVLLTSHSDTIRVNGWYYWVVGVPANYQGFVKFYETQHGLDSVWGYIADAPASSQPQLSVQTGTTLYPPYDEPIKDSEYGTGEMFQVNWRTNMQSGELPSHDFQLWKAGDNTTLTYENDLDTMRSDYYLTDNTTTADDMIHTRFALMSFNLGSGSSFDGMIIDLGLANTATNKRFYQPVVYSENVTPNVELTTTHQSPWYVEGETEGVMYDVDTTATSAGGTIAVVVTVGAACNAENDFGDATISLINPDGGVDYTTTQALVEGVNNYGLPVVSTTNGNYQARVALVNDDLTYSEIRDFQVTVSSASALTPGAGVIGGGLSPIADSWDDWLAGANLDNQMGHWIVLIVAMTLFFLILIKDKTLRVVIPLLVLGLAIVIGWVDTWVVALLALGAGLQVWRATRRASVGGEQG